MNDLIPNFVVAAGALTAVAPTIFAFKYPKQYFKFYSAFVWILAAISLTLAICDGSIERAYEITIPRKDFRRMIFKRSIAMVSRRLFRSTRTHF